MHVLDNSVKRKLSLLTLLMACVVYVELPFPKFYTDYDRPEWEDIFITELTPKANPSLPTGLYLKHLLAPS